MKTLIFAVLIGATVAALSSGIAADVANPAMSQAQDRKLAAI